MIRKTKKVEGKRCSYYSLWYWNCKVILDRLHNSISSFQVSLSFYNLWRISHFTFIQLHSKQNIWIRKRNLMWTNRVNRVRYKNYRRDQVTIATAWINCEDIYCFTSNLVQGNIDELHLLLKCSYNLFSFDTNDSQK